MCFFNTARPEENQISGMWKELEEGGSTSKREREELLWRQLDRVRRPPRYPRYRPGPTGRHRRGRGWHAVTCTREILSARAKLRGGVISRPEGGLGTGGARRDAGNRPPPTAGSWIQSYEFLAIGPGATSHGRGEEKPKGTEQLELMQGDGVTGSAIRSDRGDLALRRSRGAAARSKRGFFRRFPSSSIGIYFLHTFYIYTLRRWGSIDSHNTAVDRGRRKGGGRTGYEGSKWCSTRTGTSYPAQKMRCFRYQPRPAISRTSPVPSHYHFLVCYLTSQVYDLRIELSHPLWTRCPSHALFVRDFFLSF